jgi:Cu/Ag efflux protein CusF
MIMCQPLRVSNLKGKSLGQSRNSGKVITLVLMQVALGLSCRSPQPGKTIATTPTPSQPSVVATGPPGFPPAVLGKPYPGTGIVKIINRKEGWVEIDHEEIKDLMPAMEMEFWIRDPALMNGVSVGDKVTFVVVEDSKGEYLTELKRVAPGR